MLAVTMTGLSEAIRTRSHLSRPGPSLDRPMDQPPYHPLHYTPVNDGAKWNSIFFARVRYLANARPTGKRRVDMAGPPPRISSF
jgi:hypothetical protein